MALRIVLVVLMVTAVAQAGEVIVSSVQIPEDAREADVSVIGKGINGAMAIWIELEFDPTQLDAVDIRLAKSVQSMMGSTNVVGNRIKVALASADPIDIDGEIFTVSFKLKDTVHVGDILDIGISKYDFNEGAIEVIARGGTITVGKPSAVSPKNKLAVTWGEIKK